MLTCPSSWRRIALVRNRGDGSVYIFSCAPQPRFVAGSVRPGISASLVERRCACAWRRYVCACSHPSVPCYMLLLYCLVVYIFFVLLLRRALQLVRPVALLWNVLHRLLPGAVRMPVPSGNLLPMLCRQLCRYISCCYSAASLQLVRRASRFSVRTRRAFRLLPGTECLCPSQSAHVVTLPHAVAHSLVVTFSLTLLSCASLRWLRPSISLLLWNAIRCLFHLLLPGAGTCAVHQGVAPRAVIRLVVYVFVNSCSMRCTVARSVASGHPQTSCGTGVMPSAAA
jgi:hypothetical protein